MDYHAVELILGSLSDSAALHRQVESYQFVIANLLRLCGGSAEVPVMKYRGVTGRPFDEIPTITASLDNEKQTYTLSIDPSGAPSPGGAVVPLVVNTDPSDAMTFARAVEILERVRDDYINVFGESIEDSFDMQGIIDLIKGDPCLMKALPGEPRFTLLGRDFAAPHIILAWLSLRRELAVFTGGRQKADVMAIIAAMMSFPRRETPPTML